MARAYGLLDSVDPEEAEVSGGGTHHPLASRSINHLISLQGAMKELLGKDLFECFAAKLQELKLCEDSLHDL